MPYASLAFAYGGGSGFAALSVTSANAASPSQLHATFMSSNLTQLHTFYKSNPRTLPVRRPLQPARTFRRVVLLVFGGGFVARLFDPRFSCQGHKVGDLKTPPSPRRDGDVGALAAGPLVFAGVAFLALVVGLCLLGAAGRARQAMYGDPGRGWAAGGGGWGGGGGGAPVVGETTPLVRAPHAGLYYSAQKRP